MDPEAGRRLVSELRRGEAVAFDAVYEALRPRLFSFVLRMVGRREVAEELTQEAWLRLAARAACLREDTEIERWMFTVARNLCVSFLRTRGRERASGVASDLVEQLAAPGPSPSRQAESNEELVRLERAITSLPERYREALLLVRVEGMTPAAAADVCGVSAEAMRKRLERGRDMLAARLERPRRRPSGA
jgi:RNA polymerase sigma-70 factor (ECF subfamily)